MFQTILSRLQRLTQPLRNLLARRAQTDNAALENYLSQAESIAHLEALQRQWDRRQDRHPGFGPRARWS